MFTQYEFESVFLDVVSCDVNPQDALRVTENLAPQFAKLSSSDSSIYDLLEHVLFNYNNWVKEQVFNLIKKEQATRISERRGLLHTSL